MQNLRTFTYDKAATEVEKFIEYYKSRIVSLPQPEKSAALYMESLKDEEMAVFATILPTAAAIRIRNFNAGFRELIEEAKAYTVRQIDKILAE
jgi:hypothetical protein